MREGSHIILLQINESTIFKPLNDAVLLILQCTKFINKCCFKNQHSLNGVCLKNAAIFL